ncbi:DUF3089 domain-containing protein [Caulobacter sp. KR2-114]|uniref:DUF3089 domain-containing protein n=1 Tax=Caulobacter sp. KR2-114 TaxID=3400912 RepID=UPI003C0A125A
MRRRNPFLVALVAGYWVAAAGLATPAAGQGLLGGGPRRPFDAASAPAAPDYASPDAWAAWPGRPSAADDTPAGSGAQDRQATARADVFFIHPTTYVIGDRWNAAFDEGGLTGRGVDRAVLRGQASVFNGCCRIYAPRYRQAELAAFLRGGPDAFAAIDLAYSDVLRAFDYYIAHENHGRPFIIASHSQGSVHAMRLLQERVIGTPLMKRLVFAEIPGSSLPETIEARGLPVCRAPTQTACVVNWNSVRRGQDDTRRDERSVLWMGGRYQLAGGQPIVCVNPLTWRKDGGAGPQANLGGVAGGAMGPMPAPIPGVTGAWCEHGALGVDVSPDSGRAFNNLLTAGGIYHVYDYGLYYMNIRRNAEARVDAWLRQRTGPA